MRSSLRYSMYLLIQLSRWSFDEYLNLQSTKAILCKCWFNMSTIEYAIMISQVLMEQDGEPRGVV